MATTATATATAVLRPSSLLSTATSSTTIKQAPQQQQVHISLHKPILTSLTATFAATTILACCTSSPSLAGEQGGYHIYYGTAASAANYGGYGGNADKKATAEYVYDVPDGWKERLVSKIEKGTNGTDSEFYNPKKKQEKEYLTFLAGFRQIAPKDTVLNNLALSDVELQDLIADANSVNSEEKTDENGQIYYAYEIDGVAKHSLIKVTCARNKLYAHFVNAPNPDWNRDQDVLRHIHDSFKTVSFQ